MYRFGGLRQLRLKLSISELTAVGTKEALQGRTFTGSKKIGQYQSSILIFGIVATLINHPFQINLVCLKLQDTICTMYEQNNYFLNGWVIRTRGSKIYHLVRFGIFWVLESLV